MTGEATMTFTDIDALIEDVTRQDLLLRQSRRAAERLWAEVLAQFRSRSSR
jgi:hypothetical protein